jgi:hypothetical protein
VPAEDLNGNPHDFSESATIQGAHQVDLVGQGQYDEILGTAHLGILDSPETWKIGFEFLADPSTPLSSPSRAARDRLAAERSELITM